MFVASGLLLIGVGCLGAGPAAPRLDPESPAAGAPGLIIMSSQPAGDAVVVDGVTLPGSGYAVVVAGDPESGTVLGSSEIQPPGVNQFVVIPLGRVIVPGEKVSVVLYAEANRNTTFDPGIDEPLRDEYGKAISTQFEVTGA
jgi:hypothetical protein